MLLTRMSSTSSATASPAASPDQQQATSCKGMIFVAVLLGVIGYVNLRAASQYRLLSSSADWNIAQCTMLRAPELVKMPPWLPVFGLKDSYRVDARVALLGSTCTLPMATSLDMRRPQRL